MLDPTSNQPALSKSHLEALLELSRQGYAVVVFNPSELQKASPRSVEERLTSFGYEVIEMLNDLYESNKERL